MPVYNGEKQLERAIRSIQEQTYTDWEIIAVDDGSTDNSPQILDGFAEKDKRIKIVHKQNEGVSKARQDGVNHSVGDYIVQIDCDDWADPNYLESLYNTATKADADLVWCGVYGEEQSSSWKWSMKGPETPSELIKVLLKGEMWGTIWNRMIKSSICKSPNVSFPSDCVCWEDLAFLINALLECKTIKYCDAYLYHYDLTNSNSITHTPNFKRLLENGYIKAISHIEQKIQNAGMLDQYIYELRFRKLTVLKYYIDSQQVQDFDKFVDTYPDAIEHMDEYSNYPKRLNQCAWLIKHKLKIFVPFLLKSYGLLRRLGYKEVDLVSDDAQSNK